MNNIGHSGNRLNDFTTKFFRISFYQKITRQDVSLNNNFFTAPYFIYLFVWHHYLWNDIHPSGSFHFQTYSPLNLFFLSPAHSQSLPLTIPHSFLYQLSKP